MTTTEEVRNGTCFCHSFNLLPVSHMDGPQSWDELVAEELGGGSLGIPSDGVMRFDGEVCGAACIAPEHSLFYLALFLLSIPAMVVLVGVEYVFITT